MRIKVEISYDFRRSLFLSSVLHQKQPVLSRTHTVSNFIQNLGFSCGMEIKLNHDTFSNAHLPTGWIVFWSWSVVLIEKLTTAFVQRSRGRM